MDDTRGASRSTLGDDPEVIKYSNDYVKRLLAEAVYIYAALENPGGSVILTQTGLINADRWYEYSSQIGNPFHLDIIDLKQQMSKLSKGEQDALLAWANGLTALQAAKYLQSRGSVSLDRAIQKRKERGLQHLTRAINGEEDTNKTRRARAPRKDSNIPTDKGSEEEESCLPRDGPQADWDIESTKDSQSGDD